MPLYAQVPRTAYSGPLPEGTHRGNTGTMPCYQAPRWPMGGDGSGPGGMGGCGCGTPVPQRNSVGALAATARRATVQVLLQDPAGRLLDGTVIFYGARDYMAHTTRGRAVLQVPVGRYTALVDAPGRPRRSQVVQFRAGTSVFAMTVPAGTREPLRPLVHGMGRVDPMVAPPGSAVTPFAFRTPLSYAAWRHWAYSPGVATPHPLTTPDEVRRTYQYRSPQQFFPDGVQKMLQNTRGVINQMRKQAWEAARGGPMQGMPVKALPVDLPKFLELERLNGLQG